MKTKQEKVDLKKIFFILLLVTFANATFASTRTVLLNVEDSPGNMPYIILGFFILAFIIMSLVKYFDSKRSKRPAHKIK